MEENTNTTEAQIEEIVDKRLEQKLEEQLSQAQGSGFSRREILTGVSILGVGAAGATLGTYGAVGQTAEQNGSGSIGTEDRPLSAIYAESIGSENTPVSSIHADTFSPESIHTEYLFSRTTEPDVVAINDENGAKAVGPDGVIESGDETTVLQAAHDSVPEHGTLAIKDDFSVESINVTTPTTIIFGGEVSIADGMDEVYAFYTLEAECTLINPRIDGNRDGITQNGDKGTQNAVSLSGASDGTHVIGGLIHNVTDTAIVGGGSNLTIDGTTIKDCGEHGIYLNGGENNDIVNVMIEDTVLDLSGAGIKLRTQDGSNVDNTTITYSHDSNTKRGVQASDGCTNNDITARVSGADQAIVQVRTGPDGQKNDGNTFSVKADGGAFIGSYGSDIHTRFEDCRVTDGGGAYFNGSGRVTVDGLTVIESRFAVDMDGQFSDIYVERDGQYPARIFGGDFTVNGYHIENTDANAGSTDRALRIDGGDPTFKNGTVAGPPGGRSVRDEVGATFVDSVLGEGNPDRGYQSPGADGIFRNVTVHRNFLGSTRHIRDGNSRSSDGTPGSGNSEWDGHETRAWRHGVTVQDDTSNEPRDLYRADRQGNWIQIG